MTAHAPLMLRRWKRAEYQKLVDLGVFHGDPVELIAGQLVVAEPQGSYHAAALGAADDALRGILPPGWIVRAQMPLDLDDESVPEPDPAKFPPVAEIRATFDRVHERVLSELPAFPDAELDTLISPPHRICKTRFDCVRWCPYHEMTHAGQIGLLRRLFGQKPMW